MKLGSNKGVSLISSDHNHPLSYLFVEQSEVLPESMLRILVVLHLIVLITIVVFYQLTRKRIVTSVRGPSEETEHEFPKKFLNNLKLIYISFFIYEFGSFLTHFLALVIDPEIIRNDLHMEYAYFGVGGVNLFAWLSYLILFPTMDRLFSDLNYLKYEETRTPKYNWKYIVLLLFSILLYFYLIADSDGRLLLIKIMVLLLAPLVIAQVANYFKKSRMDMINPDILIRSRINVLGVIVSIIVAGVLIINFLFLPLDPDPRMWPTRNPVVELLILYPVFHTLFGAVGIYIIIRFPRWLRLKFDVTDEIYYRYQDSRMDYDWRQIDRSDSSDFYPVTSDVIRGETILFYNGGDDDLNFIKNIEEFFATDNKITTVQYNEEYIQKYLLPTNNIVVLANHRDAFIDLLINQAQKISGKRIQFNGNISIHGFKYNLETALFAGFPSMWHPGKSIILLLAKPKIQAALLDFVLTFGTYLNEVIKEQEIYYILKFPRIGSSYHPIPPSKYDPRKPDDNYFDKF